MKKGLNKELIKQTNSVKNLKIKKIKMGSNFVFKNYSIELYQSQRFLRKDVWNLKLCFSNAIKSMVMTMKVHARTGL